jgi:hypothetical protein
VERRLLPERTHQDLEALAEVVASMSDFLSSGV